MKNLIPLSRLEILSKNVLKNSDPIKVAIFKGNVYFQIRIKTETF